MRIILFAFLVLIFADCSLTKRKYMKGWHVSKSFHTNNPTIKQNPIQENNETAQLALKEKIEHKFIVTAKEPVSTEISLSCSNSEKHKPYILFKASHKLNLKNKRDIYLINKLFGKIKEGEDKAESKNKKQLIAVYSFFVGGLILIALGIYLLSANLASIGLGFFIGGLIVLTISIALSKNFLDDIKEQKLPYKKWPYKLISSFAITLVALACAGIFALLFALLFVQPDLVLIAIVSSGVFILLMVIAFNVINL